MEGRDDSDLDRGLLKAGHLSTNRHIRLIVAFVFLMLYCRYSQGARRPILAHHDVVVVAPEEIIRIEWKFKRWKTLIRVTSLLYSVDWTTARKMRLATKTLHFKFELPGLHLEHGAYWTCISHCGRNGKGSYWQKPP
jgi:hypothetical protein